MTPFAISVRVYYEDTDAGGVVYYANYLKYMERARTEWLRSLGFDQSALARDDGIVFAVRSVALEFLKPARFDDALEVSVSIAEMGRASIGFVQSITRAATRLCEGTVRVACLDAAKFVPCPIPDRVYAKLNGG
ncbi:MAG: tol-pal system-associated acyl-CoA thioesterase [Gammaproteobacteria bacterium]